VDEYVSAGHARPVSQQLLWWQATAAEWLPYWERAVQKRPESVAAWSGLASASLRAGDPQSTLRASAKVISLDQRLGFGYSERALALSASGQAEEATRALADGILRASTASGAWYAARLLLRMCEENRIPYDHALTVADDLMSHENPSRAAGEILRGSVLLLEGEYNAAEEAVGPALAAAPYYQEVFGGPDAETIACLARLWGGKPDAFAPLRVAGRRLMLWPTGWLVLAQLHADAGEWEKSVLAVEAYYAAAGPDGLMLPGNAPIAPVEGRLWEQLRAKAGEAKDEARLTIRGFACAALGDDGQAAQAFGAAAALPDATAVAKAGADDRRGRALIAANEKAVAHFAAESLSP